MEEFAAFVDAPTEPVFFNVKPVQGFRLVESGSTVPGDFLPIKKSPLIKVTPRDKGHTGKLLLPVGKTQEGRNAFFQDGEPLFQRFSDLDSDDDICSFASEFGNLRPGAPFDLVHREAQLETLSLWRMEISIMHKTIEIIGKYEDGKPLDEYITRQGDKVVFHVHGDLSGYNVILNFLHGESKRETALRGLVAFFNEKSQQYPATPSRIIQEGKIRSVFIPESLQAALWLQLSQSFFRDGPSDMMARRCFISGLYFPEKDLSIRTAGPHRGRAYHPVMKHRLYQRQYKRKVAATEGRVVKEGRRVKLEFLVDEF